MMASDAHRPPVNRTANTPRRPMERMGALLLPTLLIPAAVFAVGPLTLFLGNRSEMSFGLMAFGPQLLGLIAVAWGLLIGIGLLLPASWLDSYRVLLLAGGVVLWLQGSVLVGDYGVFDGRAIDWSIEAWRTPMEVAFWLLIPAIALLARRSLAPVAGFAAAALLAVQGVGLTGMAGTPAPADRSETAEDVEAPPEIFAFSSQQNGLLLVLDAFQSDAFADLVLAERSAATILDQQLAAERASGETSGPARADRLQAIEADAARLRQKLEGFTFFYEHVGAFPNTRPSIPALLSGRRYGNDEPLSTFYPQTLKKRSIIPALDRAGWEVDMVSMVRRLIRGPLAYSYRLPRPFASEDEVRGHELARLLDVSLFRHLPHRLKPWIFNHQQWRLQGGSKLARNVHQSSNGKDFLEHFVDTMSVGRDAPVFKIIHVGIPHLPVVVDERCAWIGVQPEQRSAYIDQTRCAVVMLEGLIDRLRALGLYDSMSIVVAADHGTSFQPPTFAGDPPRPAAMPWLVGRAMPLLLVKPADATGPLTVSHAPTAITDVAATLGSLLDLPETFPGTSVFELEESVSDPGEGEARVRPFAAYFWEDVAREDPYFPFIHQFDIVGPVRDSRSWRYNGTFYPEGTDLRSDRIEIGRGNAIRHLGLGWSNARHVDGERFRWALGETASMQVMLPPTALRATLRVQVPGFNDPQQIALRVDGTLVGTWNPPADTFVELTADVPAGERPPISKIELSFARYQGYLEDTRPMAAQISWLHFDEDNR